MINTTFEAYKVKREITRNGSQYEFKRFGKNEVGEPNGQSVSVGIVSGIYHEQNSSIRITTGDTTSVRTKKIPTILCLYESITPLGLQVGDFTVINSKTFKITGILNIQEWGIVSDISMEVTDNGI